MYLLYQDGDTTVHDDREQAINKLLEPTDTALYETKITPEVMTVLLPRPFSTLDKDKRVINLFDTLAANSPVKQVAHKHVVGELEYVVQHPEAAPDDISPTDARSYAYDIKKWIDERVNRGAFDEDVVSEVETRFIDATYDKIHMLWDGVSDRVGNPPDAETGELEDEMQRLKDNV